MVGRGGTEQRFGERVRRLREARGWKQTQLMRMLSDQGLALHPTTVAKIERATRPTTLNEAALIARTFGVPLAALLDDASESEAIAKARTEYLAAREYEEHWKRAAELAHHDWGQAQARTAEAEEELVQAELRREAAERLLESLTQKEQDQ